jgi:peptide/nickel transport system substrate-binding protein
MTRRGDISAVVRSATDQAAGDMSGQPSRRAMLRYAGLAGASLFMGSTMLEACSSSAPGSSGASTGKLVGGTLRYGVLGSIVDTLNPILTVDVPELHYLMYDRLTYFNAKLGVVLGMAQSRDVDEASGTVTYKLRPGQRFTDGKPVSASDVAFTFQLAKRLDQGFASFYLNDFVSATAADSSTVVVKFTAIPALDPGVLLPILPQHLWEGMSTAEVEKFPNSKPVGSGPFIFQQYTPNQNITLKRNPHWWGWKSYPGTLQTVVFTSFQNAETMAEALVSSQLDVTTDLPPTVWKSLQGKPSISAPQYPSLLFDHLGMNVYADPKDPSKPNPKSKGNPLLLDVRVRQAVNLAIDKTPLVKVALEGTGQPGSLILMPAMLGFFEVPAANSLNYDPARANSILDAAGYKMGSSGIREAPNGAKLSFRLVASTVDTVLADLGQLVIPMLKKVGIGISQFTTVEDATLANLVFSEANWDMYIWTWQSNPDPTFMLSVPLTNSIGSLNDTYFSDPKYNALVAAEASQPDQAKREQLIREAALYYYEHAAYCVLVYPNRLQAHRTDTLSGWQNVKNGVVENWTIESYLTVGGH